MYKLFRMRITVKQMNGMLANKESPYVRAIGFLYLRLCAPPAQLWDFYKDYLTDTEELTLGVRGSRPSTIGKVVRELLTEPKFFDIFLPRFTVSQNKEFAQKLKEFDAANPTTASKGQKEEGEVVERKRGRDNRSNSRERKRSRSRERRRSRSRDRDNRRDTRDRKRSNSRDRDRRRSRSRDRDNRRRSRSRSRDRKRPRDDDRDDRDSKRARNDESTPSIQKKNSNLAARAAIMSMYGASTEIKEDVNKKVGAFKSDEETFTLGSKRY
jgi:pre-mRNA-splicing factor 38B